MQATAFIGDTVRGAVLVADLADGASPRIEALMRRYANLPMDLADASLVVLGEELGKAAFFPPMHAISRAIAGRTENRLPICYLRNEAPVVLGLFLNRNTTCFYVFFRSSRLYQEVYAGCAGKHVRKGRPLHSLRAPQPGLSTFIG
jgi:hypothetical protein